MTGENVYNSSDYNLASHRLKSRAMRLGTLPARLQSPFLETGSWPRSRPRRRRPGQRGWPSTRRCVSAATVINVNREALVSQPQISQLTLQMRNSRKTFA